MRSRLISAIRGHEATVPVTARGRTQSVMAGRGRPSATCSAPLALILTLTACADPAPPPKPSLPHGISACAASFDMKDGALFSPGVRAYLLVHPGQSCSLDLQALEATQKAGLKEVGVTPPASLDTVVTGLTVTRQPEHGHVTVIGSSAAIFEAAPSMPKTERFGLALKGEDSDGAKTGDLSVTVTSTP